MGGIRRTSICGEGNKESSQRIDSVVVLLEKKRPLEEEKRRMEDEIHHIEKENHRFERENKIFREIL